jgi:hypothetical protein
MNPTTSTVTVETRDTMMGPVISGRRSGVLVAFAVEDDGGWFINLSTGGGLPLLRADGEAAALTWVTHLTNTTDAPAEAPVVSVTGDDLRLLLNLFREIASRPYVPPVVRVWIDPIDRACKVKAGAGSWSQPFGEIEATA